MVTLYQLLYPSVAIFYLATITAERDLCRRVTAVLAFSLDHI